MAASYNRRFPTIVRYGSGIIIFFLFIGLGWRSAATVKTNALHLNLLHPVMQGESGELLELSDEVTGLTARAAAVLQPDEAQLWLENGLADYSQPLTALELCLWYWDEGRVADAAAACREGHVTAEFWMRRVFSPEANISTRSDTLPYYEMATQVEPESARAWYLLGTSFAVEKRYEEAIPAFLQAVALGHPAYVDLSYAYWQTGNLAEARRILLEGITIYPDDDFAHLHLAWLAEDEEKWAEADDWYDQLIQLSTTYQATAYAGRGRIAVRSEQFPQAVAYFQQSLQLEPGNAQIWFELANAAAQSGDIPTATNAYQQVMTLKPPLPHIWLTTAEFFFQQGMVEQARIAYQQLLVLQPDNQQAQTRLAELAP